jgi:hypothetical protein
MSRIRLATAIAAVVGVSLTGCASMLSGSSSEQLQALKFESDPPGAKVRTTQDQTCTTPCALTVPPHDQEVAITRDGYMPQTVQLTTGPQANLFWLNPTPTLVPNPVHVVLQPVPKSVHHTKGHRLVSAPAPREASNPSPPSPPTQGPAAQDPAAQGAADQGVAARFSAFPSPPAKQ